VFIECREVLPEDKPASAWSLTTNLHLLPMLRMPEVYLHAPIRLHTGVFHLAQRQLYCVLSREFHFIELKNCSWECGLSTIRFRPVLQSIRSHEAGLWRQPEPLSSAETRMITELSTDLHVVSECTSHMPSLHGSQNNITHHTFTTQLFPWYMSLLVKGFARA
jgi:hypothetical protein